LIAAMKSCFWYAIGALLLAAPAHAQTSAQALAGIWQGVESDKDKPGEYWPAELRLQKSQGAELFGILYQELGGRPSTSVTFQMRGRSVAPGLRLEHGPKLDETGRTLRSYWCDGFITFTYDPALEKLTGHATYRPQGDCSVGTFIFYRVRLKSAATVPAGVESTLRVSGHKVLWYADAELQQPVNAGNTFRTTLNKTTTFYITQAYYPTKESATVPITIKVTGTRPKTPAPAPPTPPAAPPDTARPAPAAPLISTTPVVLPTVLFKVGKPELLPESGPALDQLAAELKSRPTLQIRVSGHADKVGEPDKNQVLSEQRAEAVKTYLVKAGIAPERIRTIGYGDSRPLHPSPDVRNRRVEVEEVK
jgi:outer membrane protein OmpA-like peptidoglycan-associated protein